MKRPAGRARNGALTALVFYLFLVACPESPAALIDLTEALVNTIREPRVLIAHFTAARSGEEQALPGVVLEMIALAEQHGVRRYRVSEKMRSDATIFQRSVEGLWPIRMDEAATARFFLKGEDLHDAEACRRAPGEEVVLALCD